MSEVFLHDPTYYDCKAACSADDVAGIMGSTCGCTVSTDWLHGDLRTCMPILPCRYMQHKIRQAKRAARSELSVSRGEWHRHGYASTSLLDISSIQDDIPRVHASVSAHGTTCSCRLVFNEPLDRSGAYTLS